MSISATATVSLTGRPCAIAAAPPSPHEIESAFWFPQPAVHAGSKITGKYDLRRSRTVQGKKETDEVNRMVIVAPWQAVLIPNRRVVRRPSHLI